MKTKNSNYYLISGITALLVIAGFIGFLIAVNSDKEIDAVTSVNVVKNQPDGVDIEALYGQVIPTEGITLPGTWQNIGPMLVATGAIDLEKFKAQYERSGSPLNEEQIYFFTNGSNEVIRITPENAYFMLNTLWALGLVNKNNVLSSGVMGQFAQQGKAGNLASTGGWSLGKKPGGELLNSAEVIMLTSDQQVIVERVASNSYRPCCDNPTSFPDCNHGAAALGLAELLASQGATEEQIAAAVKAANSMWFSDQYLELALYFKAVEGKDWNEVDPKIVISQEYSSGSGWANTHEKLKDMGLLPEVNRSGGSCSV